MGGRAKALGLLAMIVILIFTAGPALAGWKAVDEDGSVTLVSNGKFKNVSQDDGMISIADSEKGTMVMINDREKVYTSGKPKDYCEGMQEMMEAMMGGMLPEQRAMMEQMMKQSAPAQKQEISIKKAGSGGKVVGWDTDKYEIFVNGNLYEEVWLVTDSALVKDLAKVDFEVFREFSSCMANQPGGGFDPENSPEYVKLMKKGWEVKSVSHGDVEQHSSDTVSLEKKDIPESEFQVPPNYRKVTIRGLFSMGAN